MRAYACGRATLQLQRGDITEQRVDAIVNAANSGLLGGGGVDGAIHHAGGPTIMQECRAIGGCPTGEAVVTAAGELPCRWVIHTVGPVWDGGDAGEPQLLASAYRNGVARARELGARTLAFPSLSTGAYGYPLPAAARIALGTIAEELRDRPGSLETVRFVLFGDDALRAFEEAAEEILADG